MSVLAHTAQFSRIASTPLGAMPVQTVVFAQHLVRPGGGTWLFTRLGDTALVAIDDALDQSHLLMAGFLLAETDLVPHQDADVLALTERLRADATRGDLHLSPEQAAQLADFVSPMAVHVTISALGRDLSAVDVEAFGTWVVHLG